VGAIGAFAPLMRTKVTLLTITVYNSVNNIRDMRSISIVLSQDWCEVYFISTTIVNTYYDVASNITEIAPLNNLTGCIPTWL